MSMPSSVLVLYEMEFKAIVKHLLKNQEQGGYRKTGKFLVVDKPVLIGMLKKNGYETPENKLKTWKGLNWIKTDEDRLTIRVTDPETGKQRPMIKIFLSVYEILNALPEPMEGTDD